MIKIFEYSQRRKTCDSSTSPAQYYKIMALPESLAVQHCTILIVWYAEQYIIFATLSHHSNHSQRNISIICLTKSSSLGISIFSVINLGLMHYPVSVRLTLAVH